MNKYDTAKTVGIENALELIMEQMELTLNELDNTKRDGRSDIEYIRILSRLTGKAEALNMAFDIIKLNIQPK